uniref:Uncharacterized protein n=1 Tax=Rhizochromulina marina TaxID=1034831 RepID=A0A7S2RST3_9STRA|mmetsp:Transcript_20558/g.60039  ORF Transcript_20558/g.60039 Transcript_20558/m.60039 type:complete len:319 (+) Transcript_20558:31-987(+)
MVGSSGGAVASCFLVCPHSGRVENVGPLVRACSAFAAAALVLVGGQRFATHGAHGSQRHVKVLSAADWDEAIEYLREDCQVDVCAVLPGPTVLGASAGSSEARTALPHVLAHTLHRRLRRSTAFLLLLSKAPKTGWDDVIAQCDFSVSVAQCIPAPEPEAHTTERALENDTPRSPPPGLHLDRSMVSCIVLERFASWAAYDQRGTEGFKFLLDHADGRRQRHGWAPNVREQVEEQTSWRQLHQPGVAVLDIEDGEEEEARTSPTRDGSERQIAPGTMGEDGGAACSGLADGSAGGGGGGLGALGCLFGNGDEDEDVWW